MNPRQLLIAKVTGVLLLLNTVFPPAIYQDHDGIPDINGHFQFRPDYSAGFRFIGMMDYGYIVNLTQWVFQFGIILAVAGCAIRLFKDDHKR